MGIDVRLELENGEVLGEVLDHHMILSRAARGAFAQTSLLKYVVPWGDAMFNQAQGGDLLADIAQVRRVNPGTPLADLLSKLEALVGTLLTQTHAYLRFRGD
jgi:hypothetical protein